MGELKFEIPTDVTVLASDGSVRKFETGATRDQDTNKFDYEGFLSPRVLEAFGAYMHKHRKQSNGDLRASDNWQKGIPRDAYMKSGFRHFFDWWKWHRNEKTADAIVDILCALMFNVMGYLDEYLKGRDVGKKADWPIQA